MPYVVAYNDPSTVATPKPQTVVLVDPGKRSDVSEDEIKAYIMQLWGPSGTMAIRIATCESTMNPRATNWEDAKITGMPSMGIFQLNRPYNEKYYDWKYNVDEAYQLYKRRGFQPWSCFRKVGDVN